MKQTKRILSVTVKRMFDDSPDTSWLGEYASKPKGEYSIDRRHSLDCPVNNPHIVNQLERISSYLDKERRHAADLYEHYGQLADSARYDELETAQDTILALQECDCDESGTGGRNEYQYFNGSGNYTGEPLEDIVTYTKQDYARMESLNNQDWYYLGIRADARIVIGNLCQDITSGGLWGIESDSGEEYFKEEEENQLSELKDVLKSLGFGTRAISAAFKDVKHKDE